MFIDVVLEDGTLDVWLRLHVFVGSLTRSQGKGL